LHEILLIVQWFSTCGSQGHLTIYWGSAGNFRNLQTKLSTQPMNLFSSLPVMQPEFILLVSVF